MAIKAMDAASSPYRFRRTLMLTAVLQATLPALTACDAAVARASSPSTASSDSGAPGQASSPFSVDRDLPSLGSATDNTPSSCPDELKAAPARQDADSGASSVASAASTGGSMLQNGHAGEAAASMAKGMVTGRASQTLQDWFSALGNARVQFSADERFSLKNSELDLLHPWWETPDNMLFSQTSVHRTDDRSQGNLGFGWRHWSTGAASYGLLNGNYMTGLNTFLDYDFSRDHARMGVGAEFWRDYFKAGVNVYHRLTNWKISPDLEDYEERPADGWDIRTEGWLPSYPQLGVKLTYEQYYGHDVGLFGYDNLQKDPHAFTAGLTWTPVPLLTFTAEQRQGKQGENDSRIGVEFTWRPDQSWQAQTDPAAVGTLRTLSGNRHDFVERNNNIVLEYRKKEVIAIALPERVEGKSGMSYPLSVTLSKAKYGLDNVQWDDATLLVAGGMLTCTTLTDCSLTMPAWQSAGNNTYTVGAVATDRRGNSSARVQTTVVVTRVGISANQSTLSLAADTLPADGQSQTAVAVVLKNEDGQPVTGLAGDLVLGGTLTPDSNIVTMKTARIRAAKEKETALTALTETQPGTYESTLTTGTTAGKYALTLAYAGSTLLTSQVTLADTLADLDASTLSADKTTVVASDGTDPANVVTLTAEMKDRNGQPVSEGAGKLSFFTEADGQELPAKQDSARPGVWTADFSSTHARAQAKAGLKINGKDTGKRVSVSVTPDMISVVPDLQVTGNNVLADGNSPAMLSVITADRFGNRVGGQVVTLSTPDATVILKASTVISDDNGQGGTTLTSTTPGEKSITAELNGHQTTTTVWFVADVATAKVDSLTADVTEKPVGDGADHAIILTAVVTDATGNPVPDTEVTWHQDGGADYVLSHAQSVTDKQGNTRVTLTAPAHKMHAGITVTAQTGSAAPQTTTVVFTADAVSAQVKTLVADDPAVTEHLADGVENFAYTARVEDQYGNAVRNTAVTWTTNVHEVTLSAAQTNTGAAGDTHVTMHSTTVARNVVVSAKAVSGDAVSAPAVSFVPDAASAVFTATLAADEVVADGVTPLTLHVQLKDKSGNALAGETVTTDLSTSPEVSTADGKTEYVLDESGKTDIALLTTKAGPHEITLGATLAGGAAVQTVTGYTFVAGPVSQEHSEVRILKDAANEGGVLTVHIYPRDKNRNIIHLEAVKESLQITGTTKQGLNVIYGEQGIGDDNYRIVASVKPKGYDNDVRKNTVSVSVSGSELARDQKLAWTPDLYPGGIAPDGQVRRFSAEGFMPENSKNLLFNVDESDGEHVMILDVLPRPQNEYGSVVTMAAKTSVGNDALTGLPVRLGMEVSAVLIKPYTAEEEVRHSYSEADFYNNKIISKSFASPPTGRGTYIYDPSSTMFIFKAASVQTVDTTTGKEGVKEGYGNFVDMFRPVAFMSELRYRLGYESGTNGWQAYSILDRMVISVASGTRPDNVAYYWTNGRFTKINSSRLYPDVSIRTSDTIEINYSDAGCVNQVSPVSSAIFPGDKKTEPACRSLVEVSNRKPATVILKYNR